VGQSKKANAPKVSGELKALYAAQIVLLEQQSQFAERLSNAQMTKLGFQKDSAGNWVEIPLTGEALAAKERGEKIKRLFEERQISALEGGDYSNPTLEKKFAEEERLLTTELERGPGLNSTAGQQRLSNLRERQNIERYEAQRGDIRFGEEAIGAREGQDLSRKTALMQGLFEVGAQRTSNYGALVQGYDVAMKPWLQRQEQKFKAGLEEYYTEQKKYSAVKGVLNPTISYNGTSAGAGANTY